MWLAACPRRLLTAACLTFQALTLTTQSPLDSHFSLVGRRIKATEPRERLFLSVGCSHPEYGDFFLATFDARVSSQPHLPNETASLSTLWR